MSDSQAAKQADLDVIYERAYRLHLTPGQWLAPLPDDTPEFTQAVARTIARTAGTTARTPGTLR